MRIVIIFFVALHSFTILAKKQLLFFYSNQDYSLICDFKIVNEKVLVLENIKHLDNSELTLRAPQFLDYKNQEVFTVKVRGLKVLKESVNCTLIVPETNTEESILVRKTNATRMSMHQIQSVQIGNDIMPCGNLRRKTKRKITMFWGIKEIRIERN